MATIVSDVITYARQLAQTDSNGLTDTLGLAFANDALQNMTRELVSRNIDAAQTQETYTNLATTSPNTYAWPPDMFSLKTIEVNMTDGNQQNYLQAMPVEIANLQDMSFDWLRVNQPTSSPLFDNRGNTYEIFPTPKLAVTGGIRLFYFLTPTEYVTTSSSVVYPQTLDYRCLSARVATLYALSLDKTGMKNKYSISVMSAFENEYKERLAGIIKILAPSSQQPIQPTPLSISGWQF